MIRYVVVLGLGYVLGSKAGRRRYEQLVGTYRASDFSVQSDGANGSEITWNHHAPTIVTDQISLASNANGTMTVLGLQLSDTDTNASAESFTLSAMTEAGSGSTVAPSGSGGSLTAINGVLAAGAGGQTPAW